MIVRMAESNSSGTFVEAQPPSLSSLYDIIREKIEVYRWTHKQLSDFLQQLYPGSTGYSVRSVERFCSEAGMHRTSRLDQYHVDTHVREAIQKVDLQI